MALPVWGNLEKSQVDPEKIEEAIARLIQAHEDDPDAHVEVGESLYSHKAAEIIDHLIKSIIADKIKEGAIDLTKFSLDKTILLTCFESVDGWEFEAEGTGYHVSFVFELEIGTGAVATNWTQMLSESTPGFHSLDFAKNPFFQTTLRVSNNTNQVVYFQAGMDQYFGFKILNGTLYAIHKKTGEAEVATEISGITLTEHNVYRAVFDSTAGEIKFYVNAVLKATHDTNLPAGTDAFFMLYYIETTVASRRQLWLRDLLWMRDK